MAALSSQLHAATGRRNARAARRGAAPPARAGGLGVGYLLGRARASLLSSLDAELGSFGLNAMQYAVLKHVAEGAARTAADLCRFMYYDTGSMTRILDRLEEKGLLRRERSPEDRRVVLLRVAPAGRAQLPRLRAIGSRVLGAHLAGFRPAEVEALQRLLGRMIDNGRSDEGEHPQTRTGGKP
ncbi:MAG TPA: MarR family transcriptional regulator [Steroidobacteraceae bacterium]|nr:MarR family transcriptional regulator [Steroidobacteraceae bacterium]